MSLFAGGKSREAKYVINKIYDFFAKLSFLAQIYDEVVFLIFS